VTEHPRALVVEDERHIHDLVMLHLGMEGLACTPATDGREALALLGEQAFDLVVLDVMIPIIDGLGDLMDLARLEAGGGWFARTAQQVDSLFRRVIERHEREASSKGVSLTSRVDPPDLVAHVDPVRMEQALQNLAANALRHTGRGGTIQLDASASQGGAVIAVRDTGEGIAPEHIGHVFNRFDKADTSRVGDGRGSGLGLSIVKAIVERHGGRVTVRSQQGLETVFEIFVPNPER
jgi:signal transduction histidine kinase